MRVRPTLTFSVFVAIRLCASAQPSLPPTPEPPPRDLPPIAAETEKPLTAVPVYFPPVPPPLDRPNLQQLPAATGTEADRALADYVDEPFYAALAARLRPQDGFKNPPKPLSSKERTQLEAYRAARAAAYEEIRAELVRLQGTAGEARQKALAEFARGQAPRLVALEQKAESLRADLTPSDWLARRPWRLGDPGLARGDSASEIADVLRSYAEFQPDLSLPQRRLLHEIALDLLTATNDPAHAASQPYWQFAPEPARIVLPDIIPPALADKLGTYQTRKAALKKDLYDTVYKADGIGRVFLGGVNFRAFAAQQAPEFAALDALAEDIRGDLAHLPGRGRVLEKSPLPAPLAARVAAWVRTHETTQQETFAAIEAVRASYAGQPVAVSYSLQQQELSFNVSAAPSFRDGSPSLTNEARERLTEVATAYERNVDAQRQAFETLRNNIQSLQPAASEQLVQNVLDKALRVALQDYYRDAFFEYYLAALEPGFSVEQRRLLFGSAVQHLNLTLPYGVTPSERKKAH